MGSLASEVDTSLLAESSNKWTLAFTASFTPALCSIIMLILLCYITLKAFLIALIQLCSNTERSNTKIMYSGIEDLLKIKRNRWIREGTSAEDRESRKHKPLPMRFARQTVEEWNQAQELDKRKMNVLQQVEFRSTAAYRNLGMRTNPQGFRNPGISGHHAEGDVVEGRLRSPFIFYDDYQFSVLPP